MACTYHESPEEKLQQAIKADQALIAPWKKKLDETTNMLCHVMTVLEDADTYEHVIQKMDYIRNNIQTDVRIWFKDHKEADAKRKAELIAAAKSKLNAEEIEALGIK